MKKNLLLTTLLTFSMLLPLAAADTGYQVLGFTIGGLFALIAGAICLIAVIGKGGIASSIKGVFGMIPIGSPKLWAIIGVIFFGLVAGGFSYGWAYVAGHATTGSAIDIPPSASTGAITALACVFNAAPQTATATFNATMRSDTKDSSHYFIDVPSNNGAGSFNGTIDCTRTGDINQAGSVPCYIKGDTYQNEGSLTDAATYSVFARSTGQSRAPGVVGSQTAYLNSGSVATTSSEKEATSLVFAGGSGAVAKVSLGYYFTLPGVTNWNYLNNGSQLNAHIVCGDKEVAKFTVTHSAA